MTFSINDLFFLAFNKSDIMTKYLWTKRKETVSSSRRKTVTLLLSSLDTDTAKDSC